MTQACSLMPITLKNTGNEAVQVLKCTTWPLRLQISRPVEHGASRRKVDAHELVARNDQRHAGFDQLLQRLQQRHCIAPNDATEQRCRPVVDGRRQCQLAKIRGQHVALVGLQLRVGRRVVIGIAALGATHDGGETSNVTQ